MSWGLRPRRRPNKFGAKPTVVAGIRFASRREANRWLQLQMLVRVGAIRDLERQPRFPLDVAGVHITTYVADFRYFDVVRQRTVIEDAKGMRLPLYKLKVKLLAALHGITVVEV